VVDCNKYVKVNYDKMEGDTIKLSYTNIVLSKPPTLPLIFYWLLVNKNEPALIFKTKTCIDEGSAIIFLMKDGTKATMFNNAKFNCTGDAAVYMGGVWAKEDVLKQLSAQLATTVRVYTYKSYIEYELSETDAVNFKNTLNCLLK
jgi:hypothetical protein